MKKKKKIKTPEVPVRTATDIKWDALPNEDRAYNNITVEFKDGEEVRAASAFISLKSPKILNVRMGNPQKDFSCQHKLPEKTIKRLNERNQKILNDFQKKQDKVLQQRLKEWPTVVDMTWTKDMSRFTFHLDNGKELKVSPGLGLNGIGAGAFAIGKPYQGQPAVLYIRDQPHWDGLNKKRWDFYKKRNVVIAAKQYREKMKESRLKAMLDEPQVRTPQAPVRGKDIYGQQTSYVLRALGRAGMTYKQAQRVIKHFNIDVTDKTIRGQLWCGQARKKVDGKKKWTYPIAKLTEEQIDDLFIIGGEND